MNDKIILPRKKTNTSLVANFEERAQQLTKIVRRKSAGSVVDEADITHFSLELENLHVATIEYVASYLNTSLVHGLTSFAAANLLKYNGKNLVSRSGELSLWSKCALSFFSGFAPLLWVACFLAFLSWKPFGSPPSSVYNLALAIVLLIVIFISGLFNFYQEYEASQIIADFSVLLPKTCIVIRDGNPVEIETCYVVLGDNVQLQSGSQVPADLRIIFQSNLKVDKRYFSIIL